MFFCSLHTAEFFLRNCLCGNSNQILHDDQFHLSEASRIPFFLESLDSHLSDELMFWNLFSSLHCASMWKSQKIFVNRLLHDVCVAPEINAIFAFMITNFFCSPNFFMEFFMLFLQSSHGGIFAEELFMWKLQPNLA